MDDAPMQLLRMTGGFSAFIVGSREGDIEPVPRRMDDGLDLATTSFNSVATDVRPTMATCVDELQQMFRKESVSGLERDRPPVSIERDRTVDIYSLDAAPAWHQHVWAEPAAQGADELVKRAVCRDESFAGSDSYEKRLKALRPAFDGGWPSDRYSWCLPG